MVGIRVLFPFSLRIAALIFRAARDIKGFLVEPRYHEPPFPGGDEPVLGLPGQSESEWRDFSAGKTSLAVCVVDPSKKNSGV